MIEQPKRRGLMESRWFWSLCPGCDKLMLVKDGRYPIHVWWLLDGPPCSLSGKPHESATDGKTVACSPGPISMEG